MKFLTLVNFLFAFGLSSCGKKSAVVPANGFIPNDQNLPEKIVETN